MSYPHMDISIKAENILANGLHWVSFILNMTMKIVTWFYFCLKLLLVASNDTDMSSVTNEDLETITEISMPQTKESHPGGFVENKSKFNKHSLAVDNRMETNGNIARKVTKPSGTVTLTNNNFEHKPSTMDHDSKKFAHKPNKTLLNLTRSVIPDQNKETICDHHGMCDSANVPHWYCQCDEECEQFADCCQGYNYTHDQLQTNYKCISLIVNDIESVNIWGVQSISNCPDSYTNKTVVEKCIFGAMKDTGPLTIVEDIETTVYRNKYCAMCNGEHGDPVDVAFIGSMVSPEAVQRLTNFTRSDLLDYLYDHFSYRLLIPKKASVRYCIIDLIQNEEDRCKQYINPIMDSEHRFYRNWFCYKNTTKRLDDEVCLADLMSGIGLFLGDGLPISINKLSIMFTFRPFEASEQQCQEWNEEIEQQCSHLPIFSQAAFEMNYEIFFPENSSNIDILRVGLLTLWVKNVLNFTAIVDVSMNLEGSSVLKIHGQSIITKTSFGHEVKKIKHSVNNQKIAVIENTTPKQRFGTLSKNTNQSWLSNIETIFNDPELSINGMLYYFSLYDITIPAVNITEFCGNIEIVVSRENPEALNVLTVECITQSPKYVVSVLSVLTYISSSVSSLSLIILIVVNRKQNFHVEIPFSNLENIAVAMVFANLLFMVGTFAAHVYVNKWICYSLGVALHYSWLTVFSFTTLAVFQIVRILVGLKARNLTPNLDNARKRRLLTLIGLTMPLLFVVPAVCVDRYGPVKYSPGYGKSVCFPVQFPGNFIFFTGPVLMAIIINFISLVQIIVRIHLAKMSKGNMRRTTTFSEAKIFLRILILSGCFWVTGIIAAYLEAEWLEYIFTVLCGSQGLLVAIANLTTSRFRCCKSNFSSNSRDISLN